MTAWNEDDENNLVAAGALYMLMHMAGVSVETDGRSNELVVRLPFLLSPYRVTVERIPEEVS